MKLDDIDQLFRDNQDQFNKMPSDQLWERLDKKLEVPAVVTEAASAPAQKQRGWLRYMAAASVLFCLLGAFWWSMTQVDGKMDMAMNSKNTVETIAQKESTAKVASEKATETMESAGAIEESEPASEAVEEEVREGLVEDEEILEEEPMEKSEVLTIKEEKKVKASTESSGLKLKPKAAKRKADTKKTEVDKQVPAENKNAFAKREAPVEKTDKESVKTESTGAKKIVEAAPKKPVTAPKPQPVPKPKPVPKPEPVPEPKPVDVKPEVPVAEKVEKENLPTAKPVFTPPPPVPKLAVKDKIEEEVSEEIVAPSPKKRTVAPSTPPTPAPVVVAPVYKPSPAKTMAAPTPTPTSAPPPPSTPSPVEDRIASAPVKPAPASTTTEGGQRAASASKPMDLNKEMDMVVEEEAAAVNDNSSRTGFGEQENSEKERRFSRSNLPSSAPLKEGKAKSKKRGGAKKKVNSDALFSQVEGKWSYNKKDYSYTERWSSNGENSFTGVGIVKKSKKQVGETTFTLRKDKNGWLYTVQDKTVGTKTTYTLQAASDGKLTFNKIAGNGPQAISYTWSANQRSMQITIGSTNIVLKK